ncbi:TetR/AcrR family transcriptional regulator C-terminal domain-containing protein [Nocardioides donggukensis]|uniref:TetR/AcrR family transcriptional regulator C-terminal domain-containing protein n=1 Tax=Nocardioides donggukensis TaxID=2774019 RepID=A0A927K301_9ACTN|nr:TetR/AcrR family transcriptional regulator C-terminal domain-containing protein [Nocardioides donggukensis]MBD8868987.1 TetR/AcrR family transcriptional regulator C-terminal domain-containing protein [Nocardioides donggukensis]
MRHHRPDVIDQALVVLDDHGLADLTMRRLGAELGVRPSALYHHFANKQTLLAAVADEILARGRRPRRGTTWDERAVEVAVELRDAMLAYRDGADLVATAHAFGLGAATPYDELVAAFDAGDLPHELARTAAATVLHYVFGHAAHEQAHLQAGSAGAIDADPPAGSDFDLGLALILDGIRLRHPQDALTR